MPARGPRRTPSHASADPPADASQPTTSQLPEHRRGGQELPDDIQDRPEQNAGYDAAVRGEGTASPAEMREDIDVDGGRDRGMRIRRLPDELPPEERPEGTPDDRAERDVVAEVRRRERRSR